MSEISNRRLFKRRTLLKNLSSVVAKLPQLDLPATIRAIHTFGSVPRGKERPHDLDAFFLYSQTPQQSQRWARFQENFRTIVFHEGEEEKIRELWELLWRYCDRRLPLAQAVENKELAEALVARGVEPHWAGCFSWTEVLNYPYLIPHIDKVLRRMLVKDVKGLSFTFIPFDKFTQGKWCPHVESVVAWSPEAPDIEANLAGRTPDEMKELVLRELAKFINLISELKAQYASIKGEFVEAPIKLNFECLEQLHTEISYSSQEPYNELATKCDQARIEMRMYKEEVEVLTTVKSALEQVIERQQGEEDFKLANPIEEQVALLTIICQPKYIVKEKRLRELLHILGLPEDKVKSVRSPGSKTDYELIDMRFRVPQEPRRERNPR